LSCGYDIIMNMRVRVEVQVPRGEFSSFSLSYIEIDINKFCRWFFTQLHTSRISVNQKRFPFTSMCISSPFKALRECMYIYYILRRVLINILTNELAPSVLKLYFPSLTCVQYLFYYGLFVCTGFALVSISLCLSFFILFLPSISLYIYLSVFFSLKRIIMHCFDSQQ